MPDQRTQLKETEEVITALREVILYGGVPEMLFYLNDILGRAQNAPEFGGLSDGSIDEKTWTRIKKLEQSLGDAVLHLANEDK